MTDDDLVENDLIAELAAEIEEQAKEMGVKFTLDEVIVMTILNLMKRGLVDLDYELEELGL